MPNKLLLEEAIWEQPAHMLEQCLRFSDIHMIAAHHDMIEDTDQDDITEPDVEKLVPLLLNELPGKFERCIRFFSADEIDAINEAQRSMRENTPLADETVFHCYDLREQGFIYLFGQEDQLWPVFPKELWPVWETAMKDEALLAEIKRNQELMTYAAALANLYGIYEYEQLAVVWNQHHKEKITAEEAEKFLDDMAEYQYCYWVDDGWVISESVWNYEEFDELYEAVDHLPYFMPSKSLIASYAENGAYDENRPDLRKMTAFLERVIPQNVPRRDDLEFEIVYSCVHDQAPVDVAVALEQFEFPFEDASAVEEFSRLYQLLYENTHQWLLRGDTPSNYAREHNARVKRFSMPSLKPRKVKKVGRNDPCPCGSGKKHKKCCGA